MRSELMGMNPVLLSLTGEDNYLGKAKKKKGKFLPGLTKRVKAVANVAKWAVPGYAVVKAGQSVAKAVKAKRAKNIRNLALEKATMARKTQEAKGATLRQAVENKRLEQEAAQAEAAAAPDSTANIAPYTPDNQEAENYQEAQDAESPEQIEDETGAEEMETPSDYEESAEIMGYSRYNDDMFVGAGKFLPGLVKAGKNLQANLLKAGKAVDNTGKPIAPRPQIIPAKTGSGIIDSIKKNPLPYLAAGGVVAFVLLRKKRR